MKRIAAALAVFALLTPFLPADALAGGPPDGSHLSNVELMQLTVRGSVLEALNDLPLEGTEPIRLRSESPSEIDWFVENEVAGVLRARGAGLRLAPSPRGTVRRRSPGKKKEAVIATEAEYDVAPVLTASEGIPYPGEACREGLEGSVTAELLLNEAGSVANVIIEESTGESFESVVAEKVQEFRFTPAEVEGKKVPARVRIRFDFPAPGDGCPEAAVEGKLLSGAEEETPETPAAEEEAATDGGTGASQAAPEGERILSYRVSEMEFRYPRVFRRFWFGPKRVDRLARVRIDFRLMDGPDLLWAESAEHLVTDRVPRGALPFLETDQFPFARPEMPEGRGGRLVEPLVVAGVIGGLIVLFYANQAGD